MGKMEKMEMHLPPSPPLALPLPLAPLRTKLNKLVNRIKKRNARWGDAGSQKLGEEMMSTPNLLWAHLSKLYTVIWIIEVLYLDSKYYFHEYLKMN